MAASNPMVTQFPPPEVLEIIFSNLERIDLLNSRLVCKDWNKDCVTFFKKSTKFRLVLDYKNSDDFIKFVSSSNFNSNLNQKSVRGDQQQQSQHQPVPVMPIHLQFDVSEEKQPYGPPPSDEEKTNLRRKNAKRFEEFIVTVKKLQDVFGPECVRDLTFVYPEPYEEGFVDNLLQVLSDLSAGLEKLEIYIEFEFPPIKKPKPEEEKLIMFLFPKVKHLSLRWCGKFVKMYIIDTGINTACEFVQACPNLETLALGRVEFSDIKFWPATFLFPPPGVKSFQFAELCTDWLLNKIKEHDHTPNLLNLCLPSRFCIIVDENTEEDKIDWIWRCQEILRLFAPSLQSLTIPLTSPPRRPQPAVPFNFVIEDAKEEAEEQEFYYQVPFPLFPVLKSLTISDCSTDKNYKIDPAVFPKLEAVSIPYDVTWNWPEVEDRQFPTVKSLTLRFSLNEENLEEEECAEEYETDEEDENQEVIHKIEYFHKLFPNISKIAFANNNTRGLQDGASIQQYLKEFLQLPGTSKIKVLELINFDQNYLGVLLQQFRCPPRLVLENIRQNPYLNDGLLKIYGKLIGVGYSGPELKNLKISEEVVTSEGQGRSDICQTIVEQLEENLSFENRLINIQKIRLVLLTEEGRKEFKKECQRRCEGEEMSEAEKLYHEAIHTPKKLYLNEMMTNFPLLEEIEVSSAMFARDAASRAERMKRIMEKFPGLRINII